MPPMLNWWLRYFIGLIAVIILIGMPLTERNALDLLTRTFLCVKELRQLHF